MSAYGPALERAHQLALRYMDSLAQRPVAQNPHHGELLAALGGPLSEGGMEAAEVLQQLADAAEPGLVATTSGRYYGFVEGGVLPAALGADWLTSTWDQNPGMYTLSPAAAVVEETVADWLLDLLGLPFHSSVGFTTGAQIAIFTALSAARHHVLAQVGWDVEADGLIGAPEVRVIVGAERHVTILRALRFLGLGERRATVVASDGQGRMIPSALQEELSRSDTPTIVCAQAGNVNSGSFDPLREIASATRAHRAWLHVDGAFGLWAAASPRLRHLTEGVELADSWATDGHKTLNVTYDCGMVICAHPESHRIAHVLAAPYLVRGQGAMRNGSDWTPESSRRARAFGVWAALKSLGRSGVAELVETFCDHAEHFATTLNEHPDVEVLNDVVFTQVVFRVGDDDERTLRVAQLVQEGGEAWLGETIWRDKVALRISVSDHATSSDDVNRTLTAIENAVAKTKP